MVHVTDELQGCEDEIPPASPGLGEHIPESGRSRAAPSPLCCVILMKSRAYLRFERDRGGGHPVNPSAGKEPLGFTNPFELAIPLARDASL